MRSNRPSIRRLVGAATLLLATAGACTGGTAARPTGSAVATTAPATRTPAAASTLPEASPDAWLAVGRKGSPDLEVILASGQDTMFAALPLGVPVQPDWSRLITVGQEGPKTVLRDLVVQPGFGGPTTTIDGAWRLPTIGAEPIPVGVSADQRTIVLVEAAPATDGRTRFAILDHGVQGTARIVDLAGRFDYDALSPDGRTLYVVQHLDADAGGSYQVRAVDVASGLLQDGVIVDKRKIGEQMAGYALAQVRRDDGVVLTLYRGLEHPFIHALNTKDGWALCIDLPASGADTATTALDWGLAPTPDGRHVYAVNATLGLVSEVDPVDLAVLRTVVVRPLAVGGIVLAKFGHQEGGPVGRRVVVGPDGKTIYAAGAGGILAIDAASLEVRGTFEAGTAVNGLAVTPDGSTLFALLADGHIVKLDAASGKLVATVPGDGYDRLVAVVPW